jgi:hypothetical protein
MGDTGVAVVVVAVPSLTFAWHATIHAIGNTAHRLRLRILFSSG